MTVVLFAFIGLLLVLIFGLALAGKKLQDRLASLEESVRVSKRDIYNLKNLSHEHDAEGKLQTSSIFDSIKETTSFSDIFTMVMDRILPPRTSSIDEEKADHKLLE